MTLSEIIAAQGAFIEKYGVDPNAIIFDYDGTSDIASVLICSGALRHARTPGARSDSIVGMRVIQGDIDGFEVCLTL